MGVVRKEVLDWLNSAEDDFETAEVLFKQGVYYACAFYCQQSAEKALKAVYVHKLKKNTAYHNLVRLAEELAVPSSIISACRKLNPHYVQSRYPDAANAIPKEVYDEETAEALLGNAKEVFEARGFCSRKRLGGSQGVFEWSEKTIG